MCAKLPGLALAMWDARSDGDELALVNGRASKLWDLFKAHGGIRVAPAIANLVGLGPLRLPLPLKPLPLPAIAELEKALDALAEGDVT